MRSTGQSAQVGDDVGLKMNGILPVAGLLPLLLAGSMFGAACSSMDCQAFGAFGLIVEVVDGSQSRVCDAVVTARDDGFSEALLRDPGPPCGYDGAAEREGTYSVTVEFQGTTKVVGGVKVSSNACHVIPARIKVSLVA